MFLWGELTPASADVKRGGFFALAKKMTLFTVGWKRLLDEAAIASERAFMYKL
jgi:hypothetical protein